MKKALLYPYDLTAIQRKPKRLRADILSGGVDFTHKKIAVLGGSTTHEVTKTLDLFCLSRGIKATFYESDFGQYDTEVLTAKPELLAFSPDVIYFHTSAANICNWPNLDDTEGDVEEKLAVELARLKALWIGVRRLFDCAIIQNNFEMLPHRSLGNLDGVAFQGKTRFIRRLNERIADYASKEKNFFVNDIDFLSSRIGYDRWHNDELWRSFRYAQDFCVIPSIASSVSAIIASVFGLSKKVLIVDLDNTLWGGIIGDDGLANIRLGKDTPAGEGFSDLQTYLGELKARGVMLAVCSKNTEALALEGFSHPDSVLKPGDFVEFSANWNAKSFNIASMVKNLNVGLESAVFIDDSPFERTEVGMELPSVTVLELSENPRYTIELLDRGGYFEPIALSDEDMRRTEMYIGNRHRQCLENEVGSSEQFLISLAMQAEIGTFKDVYLERITQLINKTNQFNLTTARYTFDQVREFSVNPTNLGLYARLRDRFGDNGLVSVLMASVNGTTADIGLWLMSCRVFKRTLEYALFDAFVYNARKRGINRVQGFFKPSQKNLIVADLYDSLGFDLVEEVGDSRFYQLDLDRYVPRKNYIEIDYATD